MGDIVPDVSITHLNLEKTGCIAIELSRHARVIKGSDTDPSYGLGWSIILKPFWNCPARKEKNDILFKATNWSPTYLI